MTVIREAHAGRHLETTTMSKIWSATVSEALNGILGVVTRELVYSKVEGQVKASEVHRFRLYVDIVRDRFGGQDAQRALDDLTKEEGAEKKKVLVDKDLEKNCPDYNKIGGCTYPICKWIRKCLQWRKTSGQRLYEEGS